MYKFIKLFFLIWSVIIYWAVMGGICLSLDNFADKIAVSLKNEMLQRNPELASARIEIKIKDPDRLFNKIKNLSGLGFKVDTRFKGKLAGNVTVPVQVLADDKLVENGYVNAEIVIKKTILVADKKLKKGSLVCGEDVALEERDVTYLPPNLYFSKEQVLGKECKSLILAGTPILDWMFRPVPDIHRGDEVAIISVVGAVKIEAKGKALEDGYRDKVVRVQNLDFKKIIKATVKSSREVVR